jgi:hypothetical protein
MQGSVEEGHSIGTVLNAGFGCRGAQYWLSTECRVRWKRGEVLKGSVEEGCSIGAALNAEFGGKGAKY